MFLKKVIEIVKVEPKSGDGWELKKVETAEEKGKYFSAFKMQFVEGRAGKVLMDGWAELERGAKGLVEYTESNNPKSEEYPYQNIHGFYPTHEDSEFPPIDVSAEDERILTGHGEPLTGGTGFPAKEPTLEEKVNILWKERQ